MDIKEKLQFIEQIQKVPNREVQRAESEIGIEAIIDGELMTTDLGSCFVRTKEYDLNENHGAVSLRQIDEVSPYFLRLAGKDENLLQLNLRDAVFFDTETTGLAGGSGTYIFLTGLGYFGNDKFVIKQFFLRDFPDELAILHAIHGLLKQYSGIVSFNGKSFDWPLLQTRFTSHRIKCELMDLPHLDLLHAARRVWKRRLKDCSLGNLENEIIRVHRVNDLPSYLIPHLYFEYLRTKNSQSLKQIFYHNEIDILSLVSLTITLNQIHKAPIEQLDHAMDLRTLAKHYDNTNQWQRNIPIFQTLIQTESNLEAKTELSLQLGYCYKRLGQWENAIPLWEQLIAGGNFRVEPYEELAKYYEHRTQEYDKAEGIVVNALSNLEIMAQIQHNLYSVDDHNKLNHRLQRIRAKKER